MDVEIERDYLNQKFLTSLAPEWLMYTIVWRNRNDLDTLSLDDVYNYLKVYEHEVQKKSESNSQNMAFISSANTSSGKGEINTASVPTASTQVSPTSANVAAAGISHDNVCAYIASQSNGSQIKYEDITQINEDDIEEIHQVEHGSTEYEGWQILEKDWECKAPRSQYRGRRESFKQGPKEEEKAPKALMAIDGIGWDWSYMANEKENHALVADDEAPTEFALMAKSSSSSKNESNSRNNIDDKGYRDSGCSRHMTATVSYFSTAMFPLPVLAFCDYHNMIAILEKSEHNVDFHKIVDFVEASHIRYALTINPTVYVSHIRQFWSTARIKTTNEGTKILATVVGKPRTISESSIRRNLKLNDELLEDKDKGTAEFFGDDAPVKGRSLETGEEAGIERSTERGSNDTKEMVNILTSMDAANILTSGVTDVSVPPAAEVSTIGVPTGSDLVPTVSAIFTTASVVTPYSRRPREISAKDKGKEKMVESDTPNKKKLQEQIDVQVAREIKEEMARKDQRLNEHIARDAEIARIYAKEELKMLIDGLDRNNEFIAKYLQEYEQFVADLSIGEKIDLINELVKYQDHYAKILKYQAQQRKPLSTKEQMEFYMSILRSHSGWKTKHFRGERVKRKGLKLEQRSAKKIKTSDNVSEEDLKEMMQLVPMEEVYVEALQVKHPIIDWEIHTEGKRHYWKIIRLGGHTIVY
uniref:Uncharacterized protein n=1 Tax=Tanacetum cinerariifolium TaxID=118510 RepID=A0A6L2MAI1_TANCI|nr:hypothetical protein [Tanacetum cinerariifolium]